MQLEKEITPPTPLTKKERELLDLVDSHREELLTILQDLIKFDTRTYDANTYSNIHPAVEYCQEFFKKFDIPTEVIEAPHETDQTKTWPNLIA